MIYREISGPRRLDTQAWVLPVVLLLGGKDRSVGRQGLLLLLLLLGLAVCPRVAECSTTALRRLYCSRRLLVKLHIGLRTGVVVRVRGSAQCRARRAATTLRGVARLGRVEGMAAASGQ